MLSWRDRMVQGKRKHPSIWWPPRTSNICTWLHTNCRISKGRQCATLSSQPDLSKAWTEKPDPGLRQLPAECFLLSFYFVYSSKHIPAHCADRAFAVFFPDTASHEVFYSWHSIIRDLWVENSPCVSNGSLTSIFNTCSAICLSLLHFLPPSELWRDTEHGSLNWVSSLHLLTGRGTT